MARINSYSKITGSPADSDCFIIDSTQGAAGTRIVLWSVLKNVLSGIFATKNHVHPGSDITSTVTSATSATNDSIGQNIASTYVKEITASGTTITVKRGNDTTFTFQTQDTNTTYPVANSSNDGILSKEDYDSFHFTSTNSFDNATITTNDDGRPALMLSNHTNRPHNVKAYINAATQDEAGIMSADDKRKLDGLVASQHSVTPIPNSTIDAMFRI